MTDREIAAALAKLPEAWASTVQISWEIAGEDIELRRTVRAVLSLLVRAQVLENLYVRHATHPLECVYIDPDALRVYLAGGA